jgi:hypothetical protein
LSGGASVAGGLTVTGTTALAATTVPTLTAGDNTTGAASTAYVVGEIVRDVPTVIAGITTYGVGAYVSAGIVGSPAADSIVTGDKITVSGFASDTHVQPAGTTWRCCGVITGAPPVGLFKRIT